ncbi:MAG: hypothetical protein JXQ27_06295 [Acidobacteria bacterium]|nr:hypothetical protein [Acidobacteriota bacterium]
MAFFNRQKFIKNAQKYVNQGKLENAIKEYEKVLQHDPNDVSLLNTIGDLNLSLRRTQTSISYFKKVAQKYIDDGFYGRGLAVYRKIVRADPRNLENSEVLADLFIKEGVVSEAKKMYAEIGSEYLHANNFSKAYTVFRKLGDLTQDDPNIHLKLAELGLKLNKRDSARDCYVNAAVICTKQKNFTLGMEAAKNALEIDPQHQPTLKILFKLSLEKNEFKLITIALEKALEVTPDDPESLEMLGESYLFQGRLQDAFTVLSEIYQQNEEKYHLLYELTEAAIKLDDPDLAVAALDEIGNTLLTRKENQKMVSQLNAILEKNAVHLGALRLLSDVYYKTSDNFNYVEILKRMINASMSSGEYKEAIAIVEKLMGMDVSNEEYLEYHREAFTRLYPDEDYIPPFTGDRPLAEVNTGVFKLDTSELTEEAPVDPKSETDTSLEIDLLLSYGLKEKAKKKLQERISKDPENIESRRKLRTILKEEGESKQAANICFEIANILTLRGEHEKAAMFIEEGRTLDPSRSDMSLPTGLLKSEIQFPDELDTSNTGFDVLEIEESIDLTDDLSEILIGEEETDEEAAAFSDRLRIEPPVIPDEEPLRPAEIDTDISLRLEETLRSLQDLGLNPEDIGMESIARPSSSSAREHKPPEAAPPPVEAKAEKEAAPPPVEAKAEKEAAPDDLWEEVSVTETPSDTGKRESLADGREEAEEIVEVEEKVQFNLSVIRQEDAPAPKAPEMPVRREPVSRPAARPPARAASAGLSDKELEATLQEIDFFIKLGFKDNAVEELRNLQAGHPDHPEIVARLEKLGAVVPSAPSPAVEKTKPEPIALEGDEQEEMYKGVSGFEQPAELAEEIPAEDVDIDLFRQKLGPEGAKAEALPQLEEIAPEDVNIELFNYVADQAVDEDAGPRSSFEAKKRMPNISPPVEEETPADQEEEPGSDAIFAEVDEEEFLDNPLLFKEKATSKKAPSEQKGLYITSDEEEKAYDSEQGAPQNVTTMHNIFADIVEEANKVFASNVDDEEGDFETHYNLGIAYKEMGLLDDAIGEFQKAFQLIKDEPSSPQFIKACHILSVCFFEKGLYKSAVKWCERGINCPGHEEHEYKALKYDLAQAYERLDNGKKALEVLTEIYEVDINYRDVTTKIEELRKKIG